MAAIEIITKFFATPLGRWVLILLMLVGMAGVCELDGMRRQSDRDAKAEMARERATLAAEARVVAAKNDGLRQLRQEYDSRVAEDEKHLKAALEWASSQINAMNKEMEGYVSDSTSHVCPSVTYGYLVFRSRVSDIANGRSPAASIPPRELADAAAGVSLRELAVTDAAQASAYATCRARDAAWDKHVTELEEYAKKVYDLIHKP